MARGEVFGLGTGVLAYTLGMRHAFDADHIAAIDNTTRKLIHDGERPLSVGYFFSLGHSTVVLLLAIVLNFGIRAVNGAVQQRFLRMAQVDEHRRHIRLGHVPLPHRPPEPDRPGVDHQCHPRDATGTVRRSRAGATARQPRADEPILLGGYAKRIDAPAKMYSVGLLFGLGFDTASEVALLVLAGTAAVGGLPFYAVLSLPVLFAARHVPVRHHRRLLHELRLRLGVRPAGPQALLQPDHHRAVRVFVALFIGTIEILGLLAKESGLTGGFWGFLQGFDMNRAGFVIAGVFVVTWVVALAVWHFGDIERKWEHQAAQAARRVGADH